MNHPPCARLLAEIGVLLMRRQAGRTFTVPGEHPHWFLSFVPARPSPDEPVEPGTIFPFLDHFLEDAEHFWAGGEGGELRSGIWAESSPEGVDLHFEASACKLDAADYLLVRRLTTSFDRFQNIFQKGRELSLTHERFIAEIGKKEILLHCIIHDMSGPLQGMMGALQIAREQIQSAKGKRFVELGLLAGKEQSNLINDLLDTFRSEVSTKDAISANPLTAPDIVSCAREAIEMLQPAFAGRNVKGVFIPPSGAASIPVLAEKSRLDRVFYNLLQNAMRHSPVCGSVTISMHEEEGFVRIEVEDDGLGIPPDVVPQLFQKFVRDGKSRGRAGLGLFFCRITVEQWGGAIGCEPRAGGGTKFWFRLKRI